MRGIEQIKHIYIDQSLRGSLIAENIEKNVEDISTSLEYILDSKEIMNSFRKNGSIESKEHLLIYPHLGSFFSSCPGSDGMVCCQYFIIHLGQGCLYDCHYCYLQSFLNNPLLTVVGNLESLFEQLDKRTRNRNFHFRIGTGEYSDSLGLESLTGISEAMISYFSKHPNATLELKTKSDQVDSLLDLDHRGNTVVSWSVNPPEIIESIEEGTASLEARLLAAKKVVQAGYKVAFHLDPIIYFENWEERYHSLVDMVFRDLEPDNVAWISMGSFRYTPHLKTIMEGRFPEDLLCRSAEMLPTSDGKNRYYKDLRQKIFVSLKNKIDEVDPKLFVYLCMETRYMWKNVFGYVPETSKKLDELFEDRRKYLSAF